MFWTQPLNIQPTFRIVASMMVCLRITRTAGFARLSKQTTCFECNRNSITSFNFMSLFDAIALNGSSISLAFSMAFFCSTFQFLSLRIFGISFQSLFTVCCLPILLHLFGFASFAVAAKSSRVSSREAPDGFHSCTSVAKSQSVKSEQTSPKSPRKFRPHCRTIAMSAARLFAIASSFIGVEIVQRSENLAPTTSFFRPHLVADYTASEAA